MPIPKTLITLSLLALLAACSGQRPRPQAWVSDQLYFGTSISQPKGELSQAQWEAFLEETVTPRFPDGLTHWKAKGQWKGAKGAIEKEPSQVLLLVHPDTPEADKKVAEVIESYKARFKQESVMKLRSRGETSF